MRGRNNLRVGVRGKEVRRRWSVRDGNVPCMTRVAKRMGREVRVFRPIVVPLLQIGRVYFLHALDLCLPSQRTWRNSWRALRVLGKSEREG